MKPTPQELAEEYAKSWPKKSDWENKTRYDTRMLYEIRDYVIEAYESGYRSAIIQASEIAENNSKYVTLKHEVTAKKIAKEIKALLPKGE